MKQNQLFLNGYIDLSVNNYLRGFRMKRITMLILLFTSVMFSQKTIQNQINKNYISKITLEQNDLVAISSLNEKKILSGRLIENISRKNKLSQNAINSSEVMKESVVIYMSEYPTNEQIAQLESKNIDCYLEVWTPPIENHPYGFFIAAMPVTQLNEVLSFAFIKKMDTAEYESYPQNNSGVIAINADDVWLNGYSGTGIKIAVLDSGLDYAYDGTDIPATYDKKDYSNYPTSTDDNVENTVTGHGTHVAGSVLGRGSLSSGRSDEGNGTTAFKGSAPDADLIFLKIGSDATSSATSSAMIAAMDAAVTTYNADILTMSYGGWYTYHDGSSSTEQKVDWVYTQGVPFFISAGNSANDAQHYSGTVSANSSTGFIEITAENLAQLSFNLVWYDGLGTNNDLSLEFYDGSQVKYTSNVTQNSQTESTRGTESEYSWYNPTVTAGTYYLKVVNASSNSQFFHIYFYPQSAPKVTFASPDQEYTIGQPASADNGFAVGAWVSRKYWRASDGTGLYSYSSGETVDAIASFSSRGPRVDGGATKPNIAAPGSAIISLRDTDVYTAPNAYWIDNDGTTNAGAANYYVMQGTSMACPIAAGAAALLLHKEPTATPSQIYTAIQNSANTSGTGAVPNSTWGYGKLDILAASNDAALPVELSSFISNQNGNNIILNWITATEVNNYGFSVERKYILSPKDFSSQNESGDSFYNWEEIGFINGHGNSNSPKNYSFIDNPAKGGVVKYRLKQIDTDGSFEYSDEIEIVFDKAYKYSLGQNHPNPFNPTTMLNYTVKNDSKVVIEIYNSLGQKIVELFNGTQGSGNHSVTWNATRFSSGTYFARFTATSLSNQETFSDVKKLLLLK